ncbi:hypothetical protein DSCW_61770 [Desulfosarcina widdelii]|uniref:Uncharacterized protein n=1 Tax=Desulfosarcina widdelii TaxID=947919 RepID=A0A5K7ZD61_9BACT|nr:hypothetical protein DSCW_61770 [Desulfosarcina widdelii]
MGDTDKLFFHSNPYDVNPLIRIHPEMANLPDIFVARKILSSEYQPYACGKISRAPRSRPNFPISG